MKPIKSPLNPNTEGNDVVNLQQALQLFLNKKVYKTFQAPRTPTVAELAQLEDMLQSEIQENVFGKATTILVRFFQIQLKLGDHFRGVVEKRTASKMNALLKELGVFDEDGNGKLYTVNGKVLDSNGVALGNYQVEAFIITLKKDISIGKAITSKNGEYSISYRNPQDMYPDIQIKARKTGAIKYTALSLVKYNVSAMETLDILVSAIKVKKDPEFNNILKDVQTHLNGTALKDLKEDNKKKDITYISNKTGWDGRITAMLASSHKLGDKLKIDAAHVYALLRAGVPATEDAIKSLSMEGAKRSISNAVKKNIIPDLKNIDKTLKVLERISLDHLLKSKSASSVSTMDEMLSIRLDSSQKKNFAQIQKQVGEDTGKLWSELTQKGFAANTISKLQLDGKMGFLTGNNAPLIKEIYNKFDVKIDVELAGSGLYKASEWKSLIDNQTPDNLSADEYANHLADQVKLSYPTAVAAEMIKNDELQVGDNVPKQELTKFFYANESKNNIGVQQIKTWDGYEQLSAEAKSSVKTLERMYQITPSDAAMITLSKEGLHSAYQIAKFTKNEFLKTHGGKFSSFKEAELTYNKASEVHSAALGIATTYLTSQTLPNVYSISGKSSEEPGEITVSPSLEELLGNMDYCDCDHCKSVLSPAAYFVELLQFIDLKDITHTKLNPIVALKERRPDIENIQLSCENTNIALPYIDLVNEILEYYIVNGNLTDLKGHDINDVTSQAEVLAEPQFVNKAAYDLLKTKVYPYNLPFHQPLETLRRLIQMWDVSLEQMLSIFGTPGQSRKETLDFNEEEYKTLTDRTFKKLPEYFGEPENNTISQLNAIIANGKTFSRRLGITYEEMVTLLKTNFINDGIVVVPLLQELHISLEDLQKFYTGAITDSQMDTMIPVDIDPVEYDSDVKQWLHDNENAIMRLITLTETGEEGSKCDFAKVELRYALPDNTNNKLTAKEYHKFHRFLRLLRKTGWHIEMLDEIIRTLLPIPSGQISITNIDGVFIELFDRLANFKKIANLLSYSEKKYKNLLVVMDAANDAEFRLQQLAKILKMSIPEISELSTLAKVDPLADDMEKDEPSLMKFIWLARQLKEASIKVVDLAYILHHRDLNSKLTPTEESLLADVKILKDTLNNVERENSIPPAHADFNFAKSKMMLVYDTETTNNFFELLLNSKSFSAQLVTTEEGLPDKVNSVHPSLGFDPFKKELTFSGIVTNTTLTALENAADSLVLADVEMISTQPELDAFINDFKIAMGLLFTESDSELIAFANNFPELKTIYDAVVAETSPEGQTKKLVELILPELKARLKTNGLQQALISVLKSDPDTIGVLTASKEIIKAVSDPNQSVLHDFMELEQELVFDQNQTYNFYIDVPATDDYLIYLSAVENTEVSLKIDEIEIIPVTTLGPDQEVKNTLPKSLKAGALHIVQLVVNSLPTNKSVSILWRTKGLAKNPVPGAALYDASKVTTAKTSLIRISKAAHLKELFKFTSQELEYFASENVETKDLLNNLDTDGSISAPDLSALWSIIELLTGFNLIKKENEPEENTWLRILKDPSVKNSQGELLMEYINIWKEPDVASVLSHFGISRDKLSKLSEMEKVARAMLSINSIYYPAADVLTWITNDPSYELVADIKFQVKQKLTEAAWLETMQTVSDPVRNLLRDALVNYILQHKKPSPEVTDPDKLYEYLLIDVEMDACMKTSRIRQALSTVQLFIQRCLMNLEVNVDPASIRADQWVWMKRYRVWEANRKVFLYPENWLEPELRDNKSFMFKELEGELLQSEITDESAELAFLNYLKKLDDIAKLEIVGMYLEENEENNQFDDILHVFGRTNGNTRQNYYRRYEGGYWTPWEKVSLNIEGDHIFPIIWRKRLFVFWLNIVEKAQEGDRNKNAQTISNEAWGNHAKRNVEINLCWGEYYKGKWTSPKSTELNKPMIIKNLPSFHRDWLRFYGRTDIVENPAGKFRERLVFVVAYWGGGGGQGKATFTFTSKNAPPYMKYGVDSTIANEVINPLFHTFTKPYEAYTESTEKYYSRLLVTGRDFRVNVEQPPAALHDVITEKVLTKKNKLTPVFKITPLWHPTKNHFEAPLSYGDEHSTLFVEPEEKKTLSIRIFDGYYPIYEVYPKYADIPILVTKPIKGWPPEDLLNLKDDLPIDNPWEWNTGGIRINDNYKMMLPTTDTFVFEETVFDTGGRNIDALNRT